LPGGIDVSSFDNTGVLKMHRHRLVQVVPIGDQLGRQRVLGASLEPRWVASSPFTRVGPEVVAARASVVGDLLDH
jgi:hypothetical protein